ncbi:DUF6481 family protein [Phenylobacterium sp.]|jgi:hypothetical protein|uniref:DUF6481 family protein n=1 Tax=Phenylobacterium sp. TaxID=1871053 RepID=UPI002E359ABE|nr:DUF6481 family protein [Phenylobacterium sp.]HEX3367908.1 DUF6481 family protein [Phenylobacterium sp.]
MSGKDLKGSGLTDRLSAAADAKAALLAKLKPKPTVTDPLFEQRAALREAERKAELSEVRTARADEKEATRAAAADALAANQAAVDAAAEAALAEKRGARKERKQLTKAEAQTKRDARYAARKAR